MIVPKKGILVVEKYDDKVLSDVMVITENEDDKNLFTVKVITGSGEYKVDDILVVGRYSLFKLVFGGKESFLIEVEDILGTIE